MSNRQRPAKTVKQKPTTRRKTMTATTQAPETATTLYIPLHRLKKSPQNARKTPHPKADIEALAASIAAKGLLQNLVVEPERKQDGKASGYYLVTIGEGRRLAHLLRAKRKEITKTEPVRCILDTAHNAHEISLAENVIRSAMHPPTSSKPSPSCTARKAWPPRTSPRGSASLRPWSSSA
jgi:ParB family chromosome partitioning protein